MYFFKINFSAMSMSSLRCLRLLRLSPRDVVVAALSVALTTCMLIGPIGPRLSGYLARRYAHVPSLPQKIMASPPSTPPLDFDLVTFLSTFTAANPNYTETCKAYLRNPSEFNRPRWDFINWRWHFSQYNQDWFMFVNSSIGWQHRESKASMLNLAQMTGFECPTRRSWIFVLAGRGSA